MWWHGLYLKANALDSMVKMFPIIDIHNEPMDN